MWNAIAAVVTGAADDARILDHEVPKVSVEIELCQELKSCMIWIW